MPIYEFVCMRCESRFEELVRLDEDADCPECGSADVRRQLSVFAAHATEQPSAAGGGCCGGSCGCGR